MMTGSFLSHSFRTALMMTVVWLLADATAHAQSRSDVVAPEFVAQTPFYGSGALFTPDAYVPLGDWSVAAAAGGSVPRVGGTRTLDESAALTFAWNGRAELGLTAYSHTEYGVHAKAQVVPGTRQWPAIAVGVLNLTGAPRDIARYGLKSPGAAAAYDNYLERVSPYAVASYTYRHTRELRTTVTAGWGAGHFAVDNPAYSPNGYTAGFFGSAWADLTLSPDARLRLTIEHDAWDLNIGGTLAMRGVQLTLGFAAVDEAGGPPDAAAVNQARFFFHIGSELRELRDRLGL